MIRFVLRIGGICLGMTFGISLQAQTPSKPFGSNTSYANGVMQTYQTSAQASAVTQGWFNFWKTNFTKSCGGGKTLAVNDYNGNNAYSEGQGYGLLLAAYMGDKTLFDELWKGFKDSRNSNGVMHWTVNCNSTVAANGATDGDLDAAMALLVANRQWPNTTSPYNYASDATALITAIKDHEFMTCNGATVQKPGDMFGGCDCTNPSYYAVGYYRAFGRHVTSQAAFWEKAANDGLALLLKATNPVTGLNPAWTDQSGSITTGGNCNVAASGGGSKTDYQFDAARTPWRIVVDYLWWGTPASKQYLDKIEAWANTKGISNIVAGFRTDGTNIANYRNSAFTGAFAIGAMATTQTQVNSFYNWWVNNSTTEQNVGSRLDDKPYFQNTLRVMYSLVASGNFWNPYATGGSTNPTSVVTVSLTSPANNASFVQGSPVTFEATASSTLGATITKVEFLINGTAANTDLSSPYSYSVSNLPAGSHTVSVRATDSNGKTASSSDIVIKVTPPVVNSVVTVTIGSPASGSNFTQGTNISINANAASTNGAVITNVEFLINETVRGTDASSPYSFNISTLPAGNHTISARATDSNGKTATSAIINITVNPVTINSEVTVSLTKPSNGSGFLHGSAVEISANAYSTNGASISNVIFIIDGNQVATDNSGPYEYSVSNLSVGNHTITARATDSNGKSATSSPVTINITPSGTGGSSESIEIAKAPYAPVIDGVTDELWSKVTPVKLSKEIISPISGSSDLSATYRTLWDNQFIYVLVNVTDDIKTNDSGNEFFKDDGVELFFDIGNDKSTTYGNNDVQYTFRWSDNTIHAGPAGRSVTNIQFQMTGTATGYNLEVRIPWSTLQVIPASDQLLGLDVAVNDDDDGGDRDSKMSWAAGSDNAWQNPSLMGVAKLSSAISGLEDELYSKGIKIFPNPFSSFINIDGSEINHYSITDLTGRIIQSGVTTNVIYTSFESGVYYLTLKNITGLKPVKIIKLD